MIAGDRLPAGTGNSTLIPAMDFETYSEAGYFFDEITQRWQSVTTSPPHGLGAVGASAYSEHPSTEVLSLAYDLYDNKGPRLWIPCMQPPQELFDYFASGGIIEAWNSSFECYIWNNVCTMRMNWPRLSYLQVRDAMAKSLAHSLPGKLENATKALNTTNKIADGKRLLAKFSKPRKPTKKDPRRRIRPEEDPQDATKLYEYCLGDIVAETEISMHVPDLSPHELMVWLLDQTINFRGAAIDIDALAACTSIVDQATVKYTAELVTITGGTIRSASEFAKMAGWLGARGLHVTSLDMEHVEELLTDGTFNLSADARRVLEIRQILGSVSVKKLRSMNNRLSVDGRIRDLFQYCGAQRTARFAGRGPQPQNLPKGGPKVNRCGCGQFYGAKIVACPRCCVPTAPDRPLVEWSLEVAQEVLRIVATRTLSTVEFYFGEAIPVIVGCLRALFVAPPGHDLICSDYSAIEAVILAFLAGEEWRMEVFRTHGLIYETSASMITGIPFEEFIRYKEVTGDHHPERNKTGKYAELASGFGGWIGAWKAFGADKHLTDEQIKDAVLKWRRASPKIIEFWQGLESACIEAINNPGLCFSFRAISYGVRDDILFCKLPSGRCLTYHKPQLHAAEKPWGGPYTMITYMGWNADPKKGPIGWARLETYGGKLTENVVQACARDVQVFGMMNVERAGYPIVLHVHDETTAEIVHGFGSLEEYERLLSTMPPWAANWPIRASGGWIGRSFRKD